MPRVFYNAHLACFDVPIMAMWTRCIYVYWRAQVERRVALGDRAGVVYGLALATKHNAWFLPAVDRPARAVRQRGRALMRRPSRRAPRRLRSLLAMAVLGPLVCYALWPWLWHDTERAARVLVEFHLNHVYYNMEFLHENYYSAPFAAALHARDDRGDRADGDARALRDRGS